MVGLGWEEISQLLDEPVDTCDTMQCACPVDGCGGWLWPLRPLWQHFGKRGLLPVMQ